MKRLTYEGNYCEDIALCNASESACGGACPAKKIWERLKAYEDTGFTPQEIADMAMKSTPT